jgi:hypothetical protein
MMFIKMFPERASPVVSSLAVMTEEDHVIIRRFAGGSLSFRDAAIAVYRRHLATLGPRGNAGMEFMAEIDNSAPDIALRATYRNRVLDGIEAASIDADRRGGVAQQVAA